MRHATHKCQRGASLVEFGLLLALVSVVCLIGVAKFEFQVESKFCAFGLMLVSEDPGALFNDFYNQGESPLQEHNGKIYCKKYNAGFQQWSNILYPARDIYW